MYTSYKSPLVIYGLLTLLISKEQFGHNFYLTLEYLFFLKSLALEIEILSGL